MARIVACVAESDTVRARIAIGLRNSFSFTGHRWLQVVAKPEPQASASQPATRASSEAIATLSALSRDVAGQASKEESSIAELAKSMLLSDPETAQQFK